MFDLINSVGVPAMIGTQEIMIIAGVAVLLFGGSKIPELMRGMGQGIKEFKSAASEAATVNQTPSPSATPLEEVKTAAQTVPREVNAVQQEVKQALSSAA